MTFAEILTRFDDILYTWCLIYMLAGAGIFFTIRTRFVQLRLLGDCFKCMFEKKSSDKGISSFQDCSSFHGPARCKEQYGRGLEPG